MAMSFNHGIMVFLVLLMLIQVFQNVIQTSATPHTSKPDDKTTSTVTVIQSAVPTETTLVPYPDHKYIVSNGTGIVCIVLVADIVLHIDYNDTDYTLQTTNVTIPKDHSTSGNCDYNSNQHKQQLLKISFLNNTWSLTVIIEQNTTMSETTLDGGKVKPYYWSEIYMTYVVTEELFPGVSPDFIGEEVSVASFFLGGLFHTDGESYMCNETTVDIGPKMELSHFQYRAFGITNDDSFSNRSVTNCFSSLRPKQQKKTDVTATIIIGAVCGGLVLIFLVVYFLFRQRHHKQYKQF